MANINKIQVDSSTYDITPSSNGTFDGTSNDVADGGANSWTTVAALTTGETNGSIFTKISNMFKNIRYLYSVLGTTDISGVGASVTAAISSLNTNKASTSTFTSATAGLVPAANDGNDDIATTAYVLTGAGWAAGNKYNTDTTYTVATTEASGLIPALDGSADKCFLGDGTWGSAGSTYATVTTAAPGLMPTLDGDASKCFLGDGTWGSAGSTYATVTTAAPGLAPTLSGTATEYLNGSGTWTTPPDNNTTYATFTSDANGLVPAAKSGDTNIATTGYVLTGAGWAAGTKYNTDTNTTYGNFSTAAAGLVPKPTTAQATSGYVLCGNGWQVGTKYNTDTNTTYGNFSSAAAGLVPSASGKATSAYVLCGNGWQAGTKYNTDTNTTYANFKSGSAGLVPAPTAAQATSGYVLCGNGWQAGTKYNTDTNTTYGTNVGCYGTLSGTTLVLNTRNFRV